MGAGRPDDGPAVLAALRDLGVRTAVTGLMGSEWSEVSEQTSTVLLECANFDGPNVQASSTRLGLRTEGSARWANPHAA